MSSTSVIVHVEGKLATRQDINYVNWKIQSAIGDGSFDLLVLDMRNVEQIERDGSLYFAATVKMYRDQGRQVLFKNVPLHVRPLLEQAVRHTQFGAPDDVS